MTDQPHGLARGLTNCVIKPPPWEEATPMLTARKSHAAAVFGARTVGSKIYLMPTSTSVSGSP